MKRSIPLRISSWDFIVRVREAYACSKIICQFQSFYFSLLHFLFIFIIILIFFYFYYFYYFYCCCYLFYSCFVCFVVVFLLYFCLFLHSPSEYFGRFSFTLNLYNRLSLGCQHGTTLFPLTAKVDLAFLQISCCIRHV